MSLPMSRPVVRWQNKLDPACRFCWDLLCRPVCCFKRQPCSGTVLCSGDARCCVLWLSWRCSFLCCMSDDFVSFISLHEGRVIPTVVWRSVLTSVILTVSPCCFVALLLGSPSIVSVNILGIECWSLGHCTHVGVPPEIPGFWSAQLWTVWPFGEWNSKWQLFIKQTNNQQKKKT